MWVIKKLTLDAYAARYPDAREPLARWYAAVKTAVWRSIQEVRRTFPTADSVTVESNKTVTVFNIGGGKYRLVVAIHYNTQKVFILRFMTHAEYDKGKWKVHL